jgi:hypothetical protein
MLLVSLLEEEDTPELSLPIMTSHSEEVATSKPRRESSPKLTQ